jgi:nucleoid DNA-binding protein
MIPKKANKLYKQLAEDLNIEEDLVDKFIEHYYKEIRSALVNLKYPRINVDGLGHFAIRPGLVNAHIPKFTKDLLAHDTTTFTAYHTKKGLELKLNQLITLEEKIKVEEKRKEEFKKTKNESSIKNNLGE